MDSNIHTDPEQNSAQTENIQEQENVSQPYTEPCGRKSQKHMYPTGFDLLVIVGILAFSALAVGFLSTVAMLFWTDKMSEHSGLLTAATYFAMMGTAIVLTLLHRSKRNTQPLKLFRSGRINSPLILSGIILIFISGIVIEPVINMFPDKYMDMLNDTIGTNGWSILMTVIMAPVMEETLFRGIIQSSVSQRYGAITGIVLSSLIFGAFHIIPQQAVNAFVVGLILGYIYYRSGSLSTVIFIHAANNAIAMLTLQLLGPNADVSLQHLITNPVLYWITYGFAVILFGMCVVSTLRKLKQQPDQSPDCTPDELHN